VYLVGIIFVRRRRVRSTSFRNASVRSCYLTADRMPPFRACVLRAVRPRRSAPVLRGQFRLKIEMFCVRLSIDRTRLKFVGVPSVSIYRLFYVFWFFFVVLYVPRYTVVTMNSINVGWNIIRTLSRFVTSSAVVVSGRVVRS